MLPFTLSLTAHNTDADADRPSTARPAADLTAALARVGTGTSTTADADTIRTALDLLQRQVDAATAFAAEMADYCSPRNIAALYAQRLTERLDTARTNHRTADRP